MSATRFGLYELLSPSFLVGFTFPPAIDRFLSTLGVDTLRSTADETGVVYTGRVSFMGDGGAEPIRELPTSTGAFFQWEDVTLDFRLTVPRDGAAFIHDAAGELAAAPFNDPDLQSLLDVFGAVEQTAAAATEYPGVRFRLELLVSALTFHLDRTNWCPGVLDADFRVVRATDLGNEVKIVLPKVVLEYEQGDDPAVAPGFRVRSWGNSGFDAPSDLAVGELVRMEPPIALHASGKFGFSVEQILLDLSPDHTPPEILAFFGTDEAFEGIFVKQLRVYWADRDKGWAFNFAVRDALISFAGEVSLEASLDILGPKTNLDVETHFFEGPRDVAYTRGEPTAGNHLHLTGGSATVLNDAVVQVHVRGGVPPLAVSVTLGGTELWNPTTRQAPISPDPANPLAAGTYDLVVRVDDSGSGDDEQVFEQHIRLTVRAVGTAALTKDGMPADRGKEELGELPAITLVHTPNPPPGGFFVAHGGTRGTLETFVVVGGDTSPITVTVDGQPQTLNGRTFTIEVAESTTRTIFVQAEQSTAQEQRFDLFFEFDRPDPELDPWTALRASYVADTENPPDARFSDSTPPTQSSTNPGLHGAAALSEWVLRALPGPAGEFKLHGHASFNHVTAAARDQVLSERRRDIARDIILAARPGTVFVENEAHGHDGAGPGAEWRVARISAKLPGTPAQVDFTATVQRGPRQPAPNQNNDPPPSAPATQPNRPPSVFRRLGVRIRLERNVVVLAEVRGELDFETKMESTLRSHTAAELADPAYEDATLNLTGTGSATVNANPEDGVVDFKLTVTYDTATRFLAETLTLGASPNDTDGLLQLKNPRVNPRAPSNVLKDIFGALLIFAPVASATAAAMDGGGDWAPLAVSLGLPIGLGATGWLYTTAVTLYGGELRLRQHVPDDAVEFTDAGIVFDYGVEFGIDLPFPPIESTRPLKVRYKAIGFNLHFPPGPEDVEYQPIFDTSKGYSIDLSDPGLLAMPAPLGDLLKILGVRIARVNPLVLDLDLGLKVDLGVITVDKFKVTWPIHPLGAPRILPTGVKVDIPGTLVGKGSVDFRELPAGWAVAGSLDVTVVPIKLRIAANVAVEPIQQGDRKATAVFVGLLVEFPTPIVLGASGLGIFGFTGLFAMHFKRVEDPPNPAEAVGPALKWLDKAKGEPTNYRAESSGQPLWAPELDRWSFGVGVILGSLEGGFLVNLRGMFVLELPGPRILVFIKALIMQTLPKLDDAELTVGILGVLDINLAAKTLTVGVIVDLSIEDLIELKLPIELFFDMKDTSNWHLWIGKIEAMASARILGLVRARGYFMVDGKGIPNFPWTQGSTIALPGIAVATGLEASIVLGSESIGLYLKVAAGAHLGISFSPFFIVGKVFLSGELRLFIVSIEARGEIAVRAPNPTLLDCHVCGKVDLFFFDIEGCVDFHIGSGTHNLTPPPLVRNVYLQSHSPVLVAGQGGDAPIDATLGDARPVGGGGDIPVVPVDSVPVVQFHAPPVVSGASTFTQPLVAPPNRTPDDFIEVGGKRRVKYVLTSISLSPPVAASTTIPAAWRPEVVPPPPSQSGAGHNSAKTNIDLALMSRVPTTGEHALERSSDLDLQVSYQWGGLCDEIAPPVCVLYAFCDQPLGPSGRGWTLRGTAEPDPPGTRRSAPPPTELEVVEPQRGAGLDFLDLLSRGAGLSYRDAAVVLGRVPGAGEECTTFPNKGEEKNPFERDGRTYTVHVEEQAPADAAYFEDWGGAAGLNIKYRLRIELPTPTSEVRLRLASFAKAPNAVAYDTKGNKVDQQEAQGDLKDCQIVLGAAEIAYVDVYAPSYETLLREACFGASDKEPVPTCTRALRLPLARTRQGLQSLSIKDPGFHELREKYTDDRWTTFRTGEGMVRVLLAVDPRLLETHALEVRTLSDTGAVLSNAPLNALDLTPITGVTDGLPGNWIDPAGPWWQDVAEVAEYLLDPEFSGLVRLLLKHEVKGESLQFYISPKFNDVEYKPHTPARAIVAALEVCPGREQQRWQAQMEVAQGQLQTLTGYLEGGALVPLLARDTLYTLTVNYQAIVRDESGALQPPIAMPAQSYQFRTDDRPPRRLDPWVYGVTPGADERFHFHQDPVKIVFNDQAIVQLIAQYGKQLRFVVRGADGVPLPTHEIADMDDVAAEYGAPYREALRALIEAGLLPCAGGSGDLLHHASWTSPVPLQPSMNYSFEIAYDPPEPEPGGDPPRPVTPLFRRSFTTSRYASIAALIEATRGTRILHRVLSAPLGFTGSGEVVQPDRAIEAALTAAGEQALPAAGRTGFTIYWVFRPAANRHLPHAILIDAAEPLWRLRDEPTLEQVPGQPDPAFKRLVPAVKPSLRVVQQDGAQVVRFVRSPGGTRTIAVFADGFTPADAGTAIHLVVERPASAIYGITAATHTLLDVTLPPVAPWEDAP